MDPIHAFNILLFWSISPTRLLISWVLTHLAHVGWLSSWTGPIREMILFFLISYKDVIVVGVEAVIPTWSHLFLYTRLTVFRWLTSFNVASHPPTVFKWAAIKSLYQTYLRWTLYDCKRKCMFPNECSFPRSWKDSGFPLFQFSWIHFFTVLFHIFTSPELPACRWTDTACRILLPISGILLCLPVDKECQGILEREVLFGSNSSSLTFQIEELRPGSGETNTSSQLVSRTAHFSEIKSHVLSMAFILKLSLRWRDKYTRCNSN